MDEVVIVLFVLFLLGVLIIASPFATIWSLNVLFGLGIPFSLKTWCAVTWLFIALGVYKYNHQKSSNSQ